jgi:hypothetical protein
MLRAAWILDWIGCDAIRNGWKGKLSIIKEKKWLDLAIFI